MAILQLHLLFFVENECENLMHCKGFSHFINKKLPCICFSSGYIVTIEGLATALS